MESGKLFRFFISPPLGRVSHKRQERGYLMENGKWKVESGKWKIVSFFYFSSLGEGVAQATGEGLFN